MPVDLATHRPVGCAPQGSSSAPQAPVSDRPSTTALQGPAALAGIPILVVDDDPPSARLARVLLAGAGADVRTAYSAEEALSMLPAFPARVFLVDLILPGMSGFLLARRLKAASPHVVVLAISVVHGADTERLAIESGCVALFHKPIDVQSFVQTVARHLGLAA
jgi:CheY-like chemotaxis protein